MANIYATLLMNGRRTWSSVPDNLKEAVDAILREYVDAGKLSEERYSEIKGA